jgi:hypothetical protein
MSLHDIPLEIYKPKYFWREQGQPCPIYANCTNRITADWAHAAQYLETTPNIGTFFCVCDLCYTPRTRDNAHYFARAYDDARAFGMRCFDCANGNCPEVNT